MTRRTYCGIVAALLVFMVGQLSGYLTLDDFNWEAAKRTLLLSLAAPPLHFFIEVVWWKFSGSTLKFFPWIHEKV